MKKNTKRILSILLGVASGHYLVSKTIPKIKAKLFQKRYKDVICMRLDLIDAIAKYNYAKYKMSESILSPDDSLDASCIVSLSKAYYLAENHMLKKIQYRDLLNDSAVYDKLVSVVGKIERYEPEYSIQNMYPSIFNHTTEKETPVIDLSQFKGESGTANPDNPLKKYFE